VPITIGYEPVGAIGQAALFAGRAKGRKEAREEQLERRKLRHQIGRDQAQLALQAQQQASQEQYRQQQLAADLYKFNTSQALGLQGDAMRYQYGLAQGQQDLAGIGLQAQARSQLEAQQAQQQQDLWQYQFTAKQRDEIGRYQNARAEIEAGRGTLWDDQQTDLLLTGVSAKLAGINPQLVLQKPKAPPVQDYLAENVFENEAGTYIRQPDGKIDFRPADTPKAEGPEVSFADYSRAAAANAKALERTDYDGNTVPGDPEAANEQTQRQLEAWRSLVGRGGQQAAPVPGPAQAPAARGRGPMPAPQAAPPGPGPDPLEAHVERGVRTHVLSRANPVERDLILAAEQAPTQQAKLALNEAAHIAREYGDKEMPPEAQAEFAMYLKLAGIHGGAGGGPAAGPAAAADAGGAKAAPWRPSKKELDEIEADVRKEAAASGEPVSAGDIRERVAKRIEEKRMIREDVLAGRASSAAGKPGPAAPALPLAGWLPRAPQANAEAKPAPSAVRVRQQGNGQLLRAHDTLRQLLGKGSIHNLTPEERAAYERAKEVIRAGQGG